MDQDNNRLRLNFAFDQQHNFDASNARVYPTTPSTFPQPIYGPPGGHDYMSPNPNTHTVAGGYFMNNPFPSQQSQQQQAQYSQQYQYQQQANLQSPQPAYQSNARTQPTTNNDGTNGLIQQFSNLDSGARAGMFNRTPSPGNARPRTAGETRQTQQQYQGHLAPPMPRPTPKVEEEETQNPNKYSEMCSNVARQRNN